MLVVLILLLGVGLATAQTYTSGTGLTGIDILGAHNNGGRGCAGCHAPHSGAAGGGGNAATNAAAFNDPLSGSNALFGQDVTPLYGVSLTFGNGYVEALPSNAAAYSTNEEELRGIMMCLACHDGQIAKGQMMSGQSWEQTTGLLPKSVYGSRPIPTLLANDSGNGNTSGYGNDHPVGTQATLGALRLVTTNATTSPLTVTVTNGAISAITPTAGTTVLFQRLRQPVVLGRCPSSGRQQPGRCLHHLHHLSQPARDVHLSGPAREADRKRHRWRNLSDLLLR